MAGFIRRFLTDPGDEVLLAIESVNIIDREPPAKVTGVGSGTALLVGEFEDGDFETPEEAVSATELEQQRGGFGHVRDGLIAQDVCARDHGGEPFNGNGWLALVGKKFKRLVTVRVDARVGDVELQRLASLLGNTQQTWNLTTGQTLSWEIDGGAPVVATFTGTPATVSGIGGVYPTGFAGGETLVLRANANADDVETTFLAVDQTAANCRDRINLFMGFAFCDLNGGQLRFTSDVGGTDGDVTVVSGSAGVLAQLGLVAATTAGAGNVANIDAVTLAEVNTIVALATGNDVLVDRSADGNIRARNAATPGTGTLELLAASTATDFGFTEGDQVEADLATNTGGVIPAGTRVTDGVTEWVTMQSVTIPDGVDGGDEVSVPVRPSTDDGTALGAAVGAVTTLTDQPSFACFSVTNPLAVDAALSAAQLDAAYFDAVDSTLNVNSVAKEANFIWSARQSSNVNRKLRENAASASASGCYGRKAVIRPPLGTSRAVASADGQPGVGANRNQRAYYCWPQARVYVPQVARVGAVSGGAGFSDDGLIDLGADGFLVSLMCQLNPEENPGQLTELLPSVVGLESGAPADMGEAEYTALKAAGIVGLRIAEGVPIFQSGVTSVDPDTSPNLVNIARRNMADFIQDSLARRMLRYQKKLNTRARRTAIVSEIFTFLDGLQSRNDPSKQRIEGFVIDQKTGNTAASLAAGIFRPIVRVRTLSSLDAIVLDFEVGESVDITEAA